MNDKALHLLGLARRGRRLEVGEEPVGSICRAGRARLVLIAGDASDHTLRRAQSFCRSGKPHLLRGISADALLAIGLQIDVPARNRKIDFSGKKVIIMNLIE